MWIKNNIKLNIFNLRQICAFPRPPDIFDLHSQIGLKVAPKATDFYHTLTPHLNSVTWIETFDLINAQIDVYFCVFSQLCIYSPHC